jgi:hypothetical protein
MDSRGVHTGTSNVKMITQTESIAKTITLLKHTTGTNRSCAKVSDKHVCPVQRTVPIETLQLHECSVTVQWKQRPVATFRSCVTDSQEMHSAQTVFGIKHF